MRMEARGKSLATSKICTQTDIAYVTQPFSYVTHYIT